MSYVNLPHELDMTFENKGVVSFQKNTFKALSDSQMVWISTNQIIPINFKMRMMVLLMPNAFKKQSKKYFEDFKNFAEHGTSVSQLPEKK